MSDINLVDLLPAEEGIETPAMAKARRSMEVCNACRYCEGFCAVFPAMTLQREFSSGDLTYLANLCHSCRGCYYACQYAPPHEFAINVPEVFAEVRAESYSAHAWPPVFAKAFERNGLVLSIAIAVAIALVLGLTAYFNGAALLEAHEPIPGGGFYNVISYEAMVLVAGATFLFAAAAIAIGFVRYWKTIGLTPGDGMDGAGLIRALRDAATLRYLGGGGHGCNDQDESFSTSRRRYHHALAYGFLLCFASTSVATIYDHVFAWPAPYGFFSVPVLLGTVGGVGMTVGATGLLWLKLAGDQAPQARSQLGAETGLLVLLLLIAVTGLLLLAVRSTAAMGVTLTIHLGFVFAFFATMPYSKFVHSFYRFAALLRHAIEQRKLG